MVKQDGILSLIRFAQLNKWSVDAYGMNRFSSSFPMRKLSNIMKRVKDVIMVEDAEEYRRITVKLYGNGVLERDRVCGKEIGTKRQFRAKAGQLILSRIDARNGAFGVVPPELDGAIVTNDFWLFDVYGADEAYLMLVLSSLRFQNYWQSKSNGTTNRQRVNEADFMACEIPFPDPEEQRELVETYNRTIREARMCEAQIESSEAEIENYLFESLGIVRRQRTGKDKTGTLQFVRLKEIAQWGYDKNVVAFPYSFVKSQAHSFSNMPKWCLSITRGKSPIYAQESEAYLLNQKCNRWDEIDLTFVKPVDPLWLKKIDTNLFTQRNDILINSTGEGTLGRASLIKEERHMGLLYDSHMLCLRVDERYVNAQLLVYLINSSFGQKQIEMLKSAQATKQTELGVENVKKLLFPLPDRAEQDEIARRISAGKERIKAMRQRAENLRQLAKREFEEAVFCE